jgi:hypothetical protein
MFSVEAIDIPDAPDTTYHDKPTIEWINKLLENELNTNPENWYNVKLFKLYLEHKKIDPIHKQTRIPKYSIRNTVNEMKIWINKKWKEQY